MFALNVSGSQDESCGSVSWVGAIVSRVSCHEESISAELGAYICVTADELINQLIADYPLCAVSHTFTLTHRGRAEANAHSHTRVCCKCRYPDAQNIKHPKEGEM